MRRNRVLVGALFAVAAAALLPATTLASPNIHIGIQIGTPPQLVVVPQTPVYYAPALPYNYFFYGGQYYLFHNGIWHFAPTHNGPWAVIAVEYLPRPILAVRGGDGRRRGSGGGSGRAGESGGEPFSDVLVGSLANMTGRLLEVVPRLLAFGVFVGLGALGAWAVAGLAQTLLRAAGFG